ncbi:MAG: metal-dependent hydrolase [Chloroflexi bacterium]|nr:metal-dependent hydrolase [Chloroflexota bacterium]
MILPGHAATVVLARRYLRVDLCPMLAATFAPDLIDKFLYYIVRVTPHSRIPMHSLLGWLGTTAVVAALGWALGKRGRWGLTWLLGYGLHLLCDSPVAGGELPFLYPFQRYTHFTASKLPFSFVLGLQDVPWHALIAETLLVGVTLYLEWRRRTANGRPFSLTCWWRDLAKENQA